jgi:hypothetical protein
MVWSSGRRPELLQVRKDLPLDRLGGYLQKSIIGAPGTEEPPPFRDYMNSSKESGKASDEVRAASKATAAGVRWNSLVIVRTNSAG